ncbi:MAG: M48 family metallopeptidase [Oligoflexia bacterium]|nr:M48 family metallopeptidase [Oligoflexia bacterium]
MGILNNLGQLGQFGHFEHLEHLGCFGIFFVIVLTLTLVIKLYLGLRNQRWITQHRESVPTLFTSWISLCDHQKAADYSLAKIKSGRIFLIVDVILLFIWTVGGGLAWLDQSVGRAMGSAAMGAGVGVIGQGVSLWIIFSLMNTLLDLPQDIYSTFVLEEKYGFNRTTVKTFLTDLIKSLLLSLVFGVPIFAGLVWIMETVNIWWVWAWIFLTMIQLLLTWLFPVLIAPFFNKFSPLPEGEVKVEVERLLARTNFSYKGLFVMDASKRSAHGNAYFTGFGNFRRVVFYDTLLKSLTPSEVVAVLAHEVGHYKKKHVMKFLLLSIIGSGVGLWVLWMLAHAQWFFATFAIPQPSNYLALIIFSLIAPIFMFIFTPIFSWLSRRHEFSADSYAAKMASSADLISALMKMFKDNASTLTPDPLYALFYYSHPDASTRIQYLQRLSECERAL